VGFGWVFWGWNGVLIDPCAYGLMLLLSTRRHQRRTFTTWHPIRSFPA